MDQLIPIINRLHDAFSLVDGGSPIDLPQIVVVGAQSSGKSSVLENLVGKDFLPRGSGIVTRRPLILQLNHVVKKGVENDDLDFGEWSEDLEYGEFLHKPGEKFVNFTEIREEIKRETDRVTGTNKGVSAVPINLKVYSPNVLNLTLVDLPGITKVPVGDQPKDIESQIRKMIMQYIEKPSTIILAVSAANTDLANSDALQLARVVDPECKRTIGVLTKLDLMDKGTDAMDMLMGRVVPLRLGFVGVVNRSQKDINDNKAIKDAISKEREFFNGHPLYSKLGKKSGTPFLGTKCANILMNHIRNSIPDLRQKLNQMIQTTNEELRSYGDNSFGDNQGAILLQIISWFSSNYSQMIEGKVSDDQSVDSLYGGARINFIFNEIYSKFLLNLNPLEGLTAFDIRTAMSNATGPKSALFVPESAFELLVRRQLQRIADPALQCVDLVFDELDRIIHSMESPELQRFTNLREELSEAALNLIRSCRAPAKDMIQNLINMELNFINTSHPHFKVDQIISSVMSKRQQTQQKDAQPNQGLNPHDQQQSNRVPPPYPPKNQPTPAKQTQQQPQQQKPVQPTLPSSESPPKDDRGFFGTWFSGGKSYREGNSSQLNYQEKPSGHHTLEVGQGHNASKAAVRLQQPPSIISVTSTEGKDFEIQLLEGLLETYFNIVRTNLIDQVPKAVMFFLVSKSKQQMQNQLVQALYKEVNFERLFEESSGIVEKRRTAKNLLVVLNKAQSIINEVRDYKLPKDLTNLESL